MPRRNCIEPTNTPWPSSRSTELSGDFANQITNRIMQLGYEWTGSNAGAVRLRNSNNAVNVLCRYAGTNCRISG